MKILKKILFCSLLMFTSLGANAAFANTSMKIGVFDAKILSEEAPQAKEMMKSMETDFKERKDKLVSLETKLKQKHENLQRNKDVLSEVDLKKEEIDFNYLQQEYYKASQEFQADAMKRKMQEEEAFTKIVQKSVSEIAKKKKLDLVIQKHFSAFATDKIDITNEVLASLKAAK